MNFINRWIRKRFMGAGFIYMILPFTDQIFHYARGWPENLLTIVNAPFFLFALTFMFIVPFFLIVDAVSLWKGKRYPVSHYLYPLGGVAVLVILNQII
jgi:hypothetical protein